MNAFLNRCVEVAKKQYKEDKNLDGMVIIRAESEDPTKNVTWVSPMPKDFRSRLILLKILGISMALRETTHFAVMTLGWQTQYELENLSDEEKKKIFDEIQEGKKPSLPAEKIEVLLVHAHERGASQTSLALFKVQRDDQDDITEYIDLDVSDADSVAGTMVSGFETPDIDDIPEAVRAAAERVSSKIIAEGQSLEEWMNYNGDPFVGHSNPPTSNTIH
jgi:hypothetical protein